MRPAVARLFANALSQTLPHLAIVAMMLLALASNTSAAWTCEGQKCGVSAWTCCCARPTESDADCGKPRTHFTRGQHALEAGTCQIACHCTMVVQDNGPSVSSAQFFFATPILAVVPVTFKPTFEAPFVTAAPRSSVSRGPPARTVFLASVSLRGPPVA